MKLLTPKSAKSQDIKLEIEIKTDMIKEMIVALTHTDLMNAGVVDHRAGTDQGERMQGSNGRPNPETKTTIEETRMEED